jgi:glycosyltransferase involved in cell wall biosynthesis/protein-tyrosine-phosphatase
MKLTDTGSTTRAIRVCHVMSADLWAGAEVQVATVASRLIQRPDVMLTAALFNDGPLATELDRLGVPVTVFSEKRHSAPRIVEGLTRMLRTHAVDIVHTHRYKDTMLGALAAGMAGVPHLLRTVHGRPEPMRGWASMRFRAYDTIDRAVLQWFADGMIAVSNGVADTLEPLGSRYAPVVRLPNGINLDRVKPTRPRPAIREALGVTSDTPLIGAVGRLTPVKGLTYFLRAAQRILLKQPRARFLILGDGELRDELASEALALGLDGRCRFLGSRADVFDLVSGMDVFVMPSLDEGTPMALLEAMALGTPVVASNVGGIPDVVADRTTGLLVPVADADAIATACLTVLGNGALAGGMALRARDRVRTEFSHETNGDRLVDVYRSVMGRGSKGTIRSRLQERLRANGDTPARGTRGVAVRALLAARRRLRDAVATRRAEGARRDRATAEAALRNARHVLILCHGNIIRSAFAAQYLTKALGPTNRVGISSAGLEATPGRPSPVAPVRAAESFQIDLTGHTAAAVTAQLVEQADVILVMDVPQLVTLRRRFPTAARKSFLLTCLAPEVPPEVRDPVCGGEELCRASFDHLVRALGPVVAALRRS